MRAFLVFCVVASICTALACPPGQFGTPCKSCPRCNAGQVCPSRPVVEIESMPALGSKGSVKGTVYGVQASKLSNYRLAVVIKVGDTWWCKPTKAQHLSSIQANGKFDINISTGPHDVKATAVRVYLVKASDASRVPPALGAKSVPSSIEQVAVAHAEKLRGLLDFSGEAWHVKNFEHEAAGPGPNFFAPELVTVDEKGAMHMSVAHKNGRWRSSEVWSHKAFGYGTYEFDIEVAGGVDAIDPNLIFGAFTWDIAGNGRAPNKHRELDFEFARWGKVGDSTNGQFVVQPHATPGNLKRITIPRGRSTAHCVMEWSVGKVDFTVFSQKGGAMLHKWANAGQGVPDAGNAQWRFNFWTMFGRGPHNTDKNVVHKVTVRNFAHTPLAGAVDKSAPRAVCVAPLV